MLSDAEHRDMHSMRRHCSVKYAVPACETQGQAPAIALGNVSHKGKLLLTLTFDLFSCFLIDDLLMTCMRDPGFKTKKIC